MGNSPSKREEPRKESSSKTRSGLSDLQAQVQSGFSRLEDQNHPAAQLIDTMCGPYLDEDLDDDDDSQSRSRNRRRNKVPHESSSLYSEEDEDDMYSDGSSRRRNRRRNKSSKRQDEPSFATDSYVSDELYEDTTLTGGTMSDGDSRRHERTDEDEDTYNGVPVDNSAVAAPLPYKGNPHANQALKTPLASSFAKRCYFTKSGIGMNSQHYEGLTLTGNVVLMLATAMKLKGCPTICDEDLRRVEQTYPNQFSRLPDELLLSSGWRRISKYCHFSHKPVPDGLPFFHSKMRLHPTGGYYFLLASAVGMDDPAEVEPLNRDTLVLLETDYPDSCDNAPRELVHDPSQWTLVDRFCFFSGGPINTDEDVYYQAEMDGSVIFMLAFLSPSLTPAELYKLNSGNIKTGGTNDVGIDSNNDNGDDNEVLSAAAVREVETVYDLTNRDFDDLKLYHLGPCRALPSYILQPEAWTKVLPPHFLEARDEALKRAMAHAGSGDEEDNEYYVDGDVQQDSTSPQHQAQFTVGSSAQSRNFMAEEHTQQPVVQEDELAADDNNYSEYDEVGGGNRSFDSYREQEGAFVSQAANVARDQQMANMMHQSHQDEDPAAIVVGDGGGGDDQPPSLKKPHEYQFGSTNSTTSSNPKRSKVVGFGDAEHDFFESELRPADEEDDLNGAGSQAAEEPIMQQQQQPQNADEYYYNDDDHGQQQEQHLPEHDYFDQRVHGAADAYHYPNEQQQSPPQHHQLEVDTNNAYYGQQVQQQLPLEGELRNASYYSEQADGETGDYFPDPGFEDPMYESTSPSEEARPPRSPTSQAGTEFSQSSAMKGAQALLRRNRQRRLEKQQQQQQGDFPDPSWDDTVTPRSEVSGGTWGSEVSSGVSGSSSWTDGSDTEDRSSRRALILQMAKARMKGQGVVAKLPQEDTPATEDTTYDEEKKEMSPENIDLTGDLD